MRKQENPIIDPLTALGFEETDVAYRKVLPWILALFAFLGSSSVVAFIMYGILVPKEPEPTASTFPPVESRRRPPEPIVQGNPIEDMQKFRAGEEKALTSYAWRDKNAGVVWIPVEKAIELFAARGEQTPLGGYAVAPANPGTEAPRSPGAVQNSAPVPSSTTAPPAGITTRTPGTSAPPAAKVTPSPLDTAQPPAH